MTTDGPILAGIEVVVVGSALAADLATMVLADNGAAVTRIEPPGGDPRRARAAWRMWNRGAGSVVLSAETPADRSRLAELVAGADVLIETGWPDELAAWGLDAVAAEAPALVRCRISAFGRLGELARLPPYDGVVEARSGIMVDLGKAMGQRGQPTYRARPNPSYAAAMVTVQSIAAALLVRARDGRGQQIETSLYGATLAYDFGSSLRRQSALGLLDPAIPAFTGSPEPFLPYLVCRCRDGQWMQITNNTARLFRHWVTVIGLGQIYDDPRYAGAPFRFDDPAAKREVAELILGAMLTRTFDEWLAIFLAEGLTGDRFLTTQQALDHEQVLHNGTVLSVADPVLGPSLQLGPLVRFDASPSAPGAAAPVLDGGRAVVRDRVEVGAGRPTGGPSAGGAGPLAGLMILDFASWLAGPFGTSLLADMGARVIKIEPPQGDDARWALDGRARTFQGKESLALDLKTPEGAEVVARLLARADGLMHNMRGDASARLGIDYEKASAINPSIVYLYAGSYGSTGPGAGRAAFHPMMGALSGGVMRQLGRGNEPPSADVELDAEQLMRQSLALSRANETSPDITGALGVATAMSLALLHRQRTGHGQYVETTMLASNLYICSEDAIRFDGQPPLPLVDADLRGTSALNRLYRTADGWLFLSCPTDAEWGRFAAAAGHPQWVDDPRFVDAATRVRFDDQLIAEIAIALGARSAEQWEKLLVGAQVAGVRADAGAGEDFFLSDPHSIENGFVVLGQHSGVGRYRRAGPAAHFDRTPGAANVSHAFGQDGPAILAELGYDEATIDRWRESKILIT